VEAGLEPVGAAVLEDPYLEDTEAASASGHVPPAETEAASASGHVPLAETEAAPASGHVPDHAETEAAAASEATELRERLKLAEDRVAQVVRPWRIEVWASGLSGYVFFVLLSFSFQSGV
jgi:hypothetical protein